MTHPRLLHRRVQSVLATMLIGAMLMTSLPVATIAGTKGAPVAKPLAVSGGTAAPNSGAVKRGAVAPTLVAAKSNKATPKVAAQTPPPDYCAAVVPRNGPEWGDIEGWDLPANYSSIKLADIDGDGKDELLGRAGDGIKVYGWDTTNLRWIARNPGPALNNDPFVQAKYYETLQYADVDGVKGEELLIRSPWGMLAYHYNADADTWTLLTPVDNSGQCTATTILSDACGFDKPEYYQTIQTVQVDAGDKNRLFARASDGIHFYTLVNGHWVEGGDVIPLSDAKNFNQPQYYQTIRPAKLTKDGYVQLIVRAPDGVHAYNLVGGTNAVYSQELIPVLGLSDAQGWNFPQNYLTIQTADLDGDGAEELLARSGEGLLVYVLNRTDFPDGGGFDYKWAGPKSVLGLSDAATWNQPQYYRTIQTADLDGDKKAEVIARASDGLHVYGFTTIWTEPKKRFSLMKDATRWDQASSYLTIQTGDVDGDKRAEIIGRSSKEVETVHYSREKGFAQKVMTLMFPAFTGVQLEIYQEFGRQLAPTNINREDIRKEYTNQNTVPNFTPSDPKNPGQYQQADWDAVATQVRNEILYAQQIITFFKDQRTNLDELQTQNLGDLLTIQQSLELKEESVTADIILLVFKSILAFAGDVLGPVGEAVKAVKVIAKIAETVAEIAETAIEVAEEAGKSGGTGDDAFKGSVTKLHEELDKRYKGSLSANACLQDVTLQDWELLQSLGAPLLAGIIRSDAKYNAYGVDVANRAYQLEVWKTLTAVRWIRYCRGSIPAGSGPDEYVENYGYNAPASDPLRFGCPLQVLVINEKGWSYPTESTLELLFDPDGGLGVPIEDVFLSKNGWQIPGSGFANLPVSPSTSLASVRRCVPHCFRAPEFFLRNLGGLPRGRVIIAGSFASALINTGDAQAMRRVLQGGNSFGALSPLERFNRQYVALQLNLMTGATLTEEHLNSTVSCYEAKFPSTLLSNRELLNPGTSLRTLLEQAREAAQQNRAADFAALADALASLNGNDPSGRCSTTYLPLR